MQIISSSFDERNYLRSNASYKTMSDIYALQDAYVRRRSINYSLYISVLEEYKKFIALVSKIVSELSIRGNSISATIVISKLIQSGCFSNKSHFSCGEVDSIKGFNGINVVTGSGCCRHITAFHKDVFDELGFFDNIIPVVHEENATLQDAYGLMSNHVVNLLEYNGILCPYDTLNDAIYVFLNGLVMEKQFTNKPVTLYYKPYMDMVINGLSKEDVIKRIQLFNCSSRSSNITRKELLSIIATTSVKYFKNRELLQDFKSDSKTYIKRIVKNVDSTS